MESTAPTKRYSGRVFDGQAIEQIRSLIQAHPDTNRPSLHAPTVSHLYDREWLAVETIVDSSAVRELIPKLRAAGAEGILEYELRKMI